MIKKMDTIIDMACGNWYTQMLYTVCTLHIADVLPMHIDTLSEKVQCHSQSLYRLLRALETKGIFSIDDNRVIHNTNTSILLCKDDPSCMYHYCIMRGSYYQYYSWMNLPYSIKTGSSAIRKTLGDSMFQYLSQHPDDAYHFNQAMAGISRRVGNEIINKHRYLIPFGSHLVDIGGGNGTLLASILSSCIDLSGSVLDMIEPPTQSIDRIQHIQCDMFNPINIYGDIYILKYILHDWNDNDCVKILSNIRSCMPTTSKLFIMESIVDNCPYHKMLDMMMMVCLSDGAKERTLSEYNSLISRSSLSIESIIQLDTLNINIIICIPT